MAQRAREYRLIPEYTSEFFKRAFNKASGKSHERSDGFMEIDSVPLEIRNVAERDAIKKSYGELQRHYPRVTFDKDIAFKNPDAEFISFGHPLFEAVISWIEVNFFGLLPSGAVFNDPDGLLDGYILFSIVRVNSSSILFAGINLHCRRVAPFFHFCRCRCGRQTGGSQTGG